MSSFSQAIFTFTVNLLYERGNLAYRWRWYVYMFGTWLLIIILTANHFTVPDLWLTVWRANLENDSIDIG